MPKGDVLNFRVPVDLKVALRRAADQDERSMSQMAVRILRDWLTHKGFYGPGASGVAPKRSRA